MGSEITNAVDYFSDSNNTEKEEQGESSKQVETSPYQGLCGKCLGTGFILFEQNGETFADCYLEGDELRIKKCDCKDKSI